MNGALLINKHTGISSFGIIELLQEQMMSGQKMRRRDLPKIGHGGTLDPFASGLLIVCVGRAVKLARYFLGSDKTYEGIIRFGETTVPGDPTAPISETSTVMPESREVLQALATRLSQQPYLQTPPMHSAKKKDGKPLYELARQGIEIEREQKLCHLYSFDILNYEKPRAQFRLRCSSGTYVRTLAQDYSRMLGTVGLLEELARTASGMFRVADAWTTDQIFAATAEGQLWDELPCWIPFDRLLEGFPRALATQEETDDLLQGRQSVLFNILRRAEKGPANSSHLAIYCAHRLIAVACYEQSAWRLERVFT